MATLHQGALFCRVVLESKVISGMERRKEAHLSRYSCSITMVRKNCRSDIRMERL